MGGVARNLGGIWEVPCFVDGIARKLFAGGSLLIGLDMDSAVLHLGSAPLGEVNVLITWSDTRGSGALIFHISLPSDTRESGATSNFAIAFYLLHLSAVGHSGVGCG